MSYPNKVTEWLMERFEAEQEKEKAELEKIKTEECNEKTEENQRV